MLSKEDLTFSKLLSHAWPEGFWRWTVRITTIITFLIVYRIFRNPWLVGKWFVCLHQVWMVPASMSPSHRTSLNPNPAGTFDSLDLTTETEKSSESCGSEINHNEENAQNNSHSYCLIVTDCIICKSYAILLNFDNILFLLRTGSWCPPRQMALNYSCNI
jgi:hypothetical protein